MRRLNTDLDCTVSSIRLTTAGYRYVVLHEETYTFVAAPALQKRRAFDASEHTPLDLDADLPLFRYFLDGQPRASLFTFAAQEHLGTIAAVRHRAVAGAGVAVLPTYFIRADLEKRRLVEVFPKARLSKDAFRLVWRDRHPLERELQRLAEELKALPLR